MSPVCSQPRRSHACRATWVGRRRATPTEALVACDYAVSGASVWRVTSGPVQSRRPNGTAPTVNTCTSEVAMRLPMVGSREASKTGRADQYPGSSPGCGRAPPSGGAQLRETTQTSLRWGVGMITVHRVDQTGLHRTLRRPQLGSVRTTEVAPNHGCRARDCRARRRLVTSPSRVCQTPKPEIICAEEATIHYRYRMTRR